MEWVVVTTRTIKLPGSPPTPCVRPTSSAEKRAFVGMFVIMRQFIMRYGCVRFRVIIQMAVHMQMAFAIMFMDMNMDTATIHPPDQLHAKI